MTRLEFTREFAEMLSTDPDNFCGETELGSLPEWDSVAYLSAMVMIDERLGITVRPDVISNATTFSDILAAVHSALQD